MIKPDYINKWNKYTIGNIGWIKDRKNHLCRRLFVRYVLKNYYKSVLEIGAGECTEAIMLKHHQIDYTVCDISDTFLKFAKQYSIKVIKSCMTNIPVLTKSFDIVYLNQVIEHTPDVIKTISELSRISQHYFITLFKWKYSGGLKSMYNSRKHYYSTAFNIHKLLNLILKYGTITNAVITTKDNELCKFSEQNQNVSSPMHRNGNYLSIYGKWN